MALATRDYEANGRDRLVITAGALLLRVLVVLWAAPRFPPAADGKYYHIVAARIAHGLGYTWLWPDGAVTYAAHYPIGYPALLGGLYAIFGERPAVAMWLNAVLGTVVVWCVHRVVSRFAPRRAAMAAGVLAAIHPTLLFYTPAMMTELLAAALCILGAALAFQCPRSSVSSWLTLVCIGLVTGLGSLVRPQQLLFGPFFGVMFVLQQTRRGETRAPASSIPWRKAAAAVAVTIGLGVAVCLPWTFRNCERMGQCVFVSANAGWNLLIGTSTKGRGAWASVDDVGVPSECREVFAEAAKDSCFGAAAKREIIRRPVAWLKLAPAKLEKTFDDVGAPGYYLNAADWHFFDDRAKVALGTLEVLFQRLTMLIAFVGLARVPGPGRSLRVSLAAVAIGCLFCTYAWLGLILFCVGVLSLKQRVTTEPLLLSAAFAYGTTMLVHAAFFGGARYAIVVLPFMIAAAARSLGRESASPLAAD